MCRPVSSRSQAIVQDLAHQPAADPPIGYRLHFASEMPNLALSPATDVGALQDFGAAGDGRDLRRRRSSGLVSRRPLRSASIRSGRSRRS